MDYDEEIDYHEDFDDMLGGKGKKKNKKSKGKANAKNKA